MSPVRLLDGGRLVYGGSPRRFLRLSEAGAGAFRRLLLADDRSAVPALAQRLVDAGILSPARPADDAPLPSYAIVIPHYNDPDAAVETLNLLTSDLSDRDHHRLAVIVVDDGSEPQLRAELELQIDQFRSDGFDVDLVLRQKNGGPGAARNAGFAHSNGEATVFVDSGVTIDLESVESLVRWTNVADAVGPRVISPERSGLVGQFEAKNSALDMTAVSPTGAGTEPRLVGPQRTIRYLPTAVLAVRNRSMQETGAFDEAMRTGEDVDLVWRLVDAGKRVIFDPVIAADHEPRGSVRAFAAQRFGYGLSGGPLGHRHGSTIAPAVARYPLLAAVASLMIAPLRVGLGLTATAGVFDAIETGRRFSSTASGYPTATALGAAESIRFNSAVSRWWIRASVRAWWPLTALLVLQPFSRRLQRRASVVVALRLADFVATVGATQTPMALLDEIAYGTGLWVGALRARSLRALLPRILGS